MANAHKLRRISAGKSLVHETFTTLLQVIKIFDKKTHEKLNSKPLPEQTKKHNKYNCNHPPRFNNIPSMHESLELSINVSKRNQTPKR